MVELLKAEYDMLIAIRVYKGSKGVPSNSSIYDLSSEGTADRTMISLSRSNFDSEELFVYFSVEFDFPKNARFCVYYNILEKGLISIYFNEYINSSILINEKVPAI